MRYVLASGSPRRRELFSKVVPEYEVIPATGEEVTKKELPADIVEELSYQKAYEIFYKNLTDCSEGFVVIGSDTVVSYRHKVLGKPADKEDAARMIRMLQGQTHSVYTGVTVFYRKAGKTGNFTFNECTDVHVAPMSEDEISSYVATKEPDDKAGAYGIQGQFAIYISGIDGDYYNVMGLPVARLYKEMRDHDLLE